MQKVSFIKNSFQNSAYKKHFHNTYSISLITKGECNFCVKGVSHIAKEGMIRVINPYEMHEIYSSSWEHINLVVTTYFVHMIVQENISFHTLIEDIKLFLMLENLYMQKGYQDSKIRDILDYMSKNYSSQNEKKDPLHVEQKELQRAIEYIYQNANNYEINLDEIVSYIGLSKYHFLRVFKQKFGLTPYKYIQNIKINNARKMLYLSMPLSQIAQECGFYDQSHLIKTYKKFFGHTPSKLYKQQ